MSVILIADDKKNLRDILKMMLEMDHLETLEAGDGANALAKVREYSPDLMILDLWMPRMSGEEVLESLAKEGKTIPTIVISGVHSSNHAAIELVSKYPYVTYLEKPFDLNMLRKTILQILNIVSHSKIE